MFDTGRLRLHYLDYGGRGARPPLVVLHGHTDNAWSWHHISSVLADEHWVVAVDLRGHGDSEAGPYTPQHLGSDLLAVIDHLGVDRVAVLAHSLGGHMSTQVAGAFPDRVERLVMVEALGPPRAADATQEDWRAIAAVRIEGLRAPVERRPMVDLDDAAQRFGRQNPGLASGLLAALIPRLVRPADDGVGVVWKFDPASRDWVVTHDHARVETMWSGVACPVLHVIGANAYERFWSKMAGAAVNGLDGPMSDVELARRLACFADQRHVVLHNCGHMVHYDQPDALLAAIRPFLLER